MTLEEFLNKLDQGLKDYRDDQSTSFMKYFCVYTTEGTAANLAINKAIDFLLTDPVFIARLRSCITYVMAMTAAAMLSNNDGKETK